MDQLAQSRWSKNMAYRVGYGGSYETGYQSRMPRLRALPLTSWVSPREIRTYVHQTTRIRMLTAALFITETGNNPSAHQEENRLTNWGGVVQWVPTEQQQRQGCYAE